MAVHVVKVPDIGEGIAEVELVEWLVKAGDAVAEDQSLAIVMTDKASVEIPSPVAGTVTRLAGEVGQMLAVGAELAGIEPQAAGEGTAAGHSVGAGEAIAAGSADRAGPAGRAGPAAQAGPAVQAGPAMSPPVAAQAVARAGGEKPLASPSVRRHARELGVDLRQVPGSGPGGRVRHEDVETFAAHTRSAPGAGRPPAREPAAAAARAGAAPARASASYAERHDEQAVPVIGLRRRIAEAMQEAKRRIPHFSYVEEVDVTELEALRAQLNAKHGAGRGRLTVLPFVLRALVLAVRELPQVNARYDDDAGVVTRHGAVHVGIATQTDAGLMVPVLRHAEALDLWATAAEIARLAQAARGGKALREELSGSTITVTSLGALGGIASTPVINRPEVAIVGVNRIVERPAIRGGAVVARRIMNLSSSFDHRVVDGMHGAEFVQALRGYLECPATMFVEWRRRAATPSKPRGFASGLESVGGRQPGARRHACRRHDHDFAAGRDDPLADVVEQVIELGIAEVALHDAAVAGVETARNDAVGFDQQRGDLAGGRGLGDIGEVVAAEPLRPGRLESVDQAGEPREVPRLDELPRPRAQLLEREIVRMQVDRLGRQHWIAADAAELVMMFGQRRQQQRQARGARVVLEHVGIDRAEEALGLVVPRRLFHVRAMPRGRAQCARAVYPRGALACRRRRRRVDGQVDLVDRVPVTLEERGLVPIESEDVIAIGRLQDAQQRLGVETVGHHGQFGHWPLQPVGAKEARRRENGQSVQGVIPELAIGSQCLERRQQRRGFARRILALQGFGQRLRQVAKADWILLVVGVASVRRLVHGKARRLVRARQHLGVVFGG